MASGDDELPEEIKQYLQEQDNIIAQLQKLQDPHWRKKPEQRQRAVWEAALQWTRGRWALWVPATMHDTEGDSTTSAFEQTQAKVDQASLPSARARIIRNDLDGNIGFRWWAVTWPSGPDELHTSQKCGDLWWCQIWAVDIWRLPDGTIWRPISNCKGIWKGNWWAIETLKSDPQVCYLTNILWQDLENTSSQRQFMRHLAGTRMWFSHFVIWQILSCNIWRIHSVERRPSHAGSVGISNTHLAELWIPFRDHLSQ